MDLKDLKYIYNINGINNGIRNSYINDMVDDYDEARQHVINRFDVLINTIDAKDIFVNNSENSIKAVIDNKKEQSESTDFTRVVQTYPHSIRCGDLIKYKINSNDEIKNYLVKNVVLQKDTYEQGIIIECDKTLSWTDITNNEILCPASSSSISSYQTNVNQSIVNLNELTDLRIQLTISSNIEEFNNIPNWVTIKELYPNSKFMITQRTDNVKEGIIEISCVKDIFTDSMEILNYHEGVNPDYGYNESFWVIDEGDFKGLLTTRKAEDITKEWGYDVKVTDVLYTPQNNLISESTLIRKDKVVYKVVKMVECKNPDKRLENYWTIGLIKNENQNIDIKVGE